MENMHEGQVEQVKIKRPPGLTILCIMSMAGSGLSAISSFFIAAAFEQLPEAVKQTGLPEADAMLTMITSAGKSFFVIMGILYAVSLWGVIAMFLLRKPGFHLYTSSQLIMLIVPSLMISGFSLPFSNVLLTATFIVAYALNLRIMR